MGAVLELVSYLFTPLGAIIAIGVGAATFFFARWVLTD